MVNNLNVVHRDLKLDNIFVHFKNLKLDDVFGDPSHFEYHKVNAVLNEDVNIVIGDLGFAVQLN